MTNRKQNEQEDTQDIAKEIGIDNSASLGVLQVGWSASEEEITRAILAAIRSSEGQPFVVVQSKKPTLH